jgi:DMSO/TMAO reductase YedYZ heme-binding membrane subunit
MNSTNRIQSHPLTGGFRAPPPSVLQAVLIVCLALPGVTWISTVGNLADYWRYEVAPGQVLYLLSKLAGLYAFVAFWLQLMYGLLGASGRRRLKVECGHAFHRTLGVLVMVLVATHVALFVTGSSIRAHHFASQYLTPTFSSGYYRSIITFGIIAAILLLIAVVSAAGRRMVGRIWRIQHWAVIPAYSLAFTHSLLIGSESRIGPVAALYLLMAVSTVIGLAARIWTPWSRGGRVA